MHPCGFSWVSALRASFERVRTASCLIGSPGKVGILTGRLSSGVHCRGEDSITLTCSEQQQPLQLVTVFSGSILWLSRRTKSAALHDATAEQPPRVPLTRNSVAHGRRPRWPCVTSWFPFSRSLLFVRDNSRTNAQALVEGCLAFRVRDTCRPRFWLSSE